MFRDFTLHFQSQNRSVLKARVRVHQPLAFKQLKGLKSACAQYGRRGPPFTQAMPESGPQRSSLLGTIGKGMLVRRRFFIMEIRIC